MKILFAASEAAPFLKSGGLGDVLEALPAELAKDPENEIAVFLPLYKRIKDNSALSLTFVTSFPLPIPLSEEYVGIFTAKRGRVTYYFVDNEYYFYRDGTPYGHGDDGDRFVFFSKAILESFAYLDYYPDVIHANDWQTAALPVFLKTCYAHMPAYRGIKTLFTIHNIEYQGYFSRGFVTGAMGLEGSVEDALMWGDSVNLMKGAILFSDRVTTVSRTYAHEIKYAYFSHGLDPVLRENEHKLSGIVNGINTELYDPKTDPALPARFSSRDLSGKAVCKSELQRELGLPVREDVPVIAMITRLVSHKGLALVAHVLEDILSMDVQLVVLGTGDKEYEDMFRFAEYTHPERLAARITFDSALASRIYAGADLFLMPSKSEPCGLSQLIAMRYGTIPIVRETGGLFDTVPALDPKTLAGRGFTFKTFNAHDMLDAVRRAVEFLKDGGARDKHRRALIRYNSSWKGSAEEYLTLYRALQNQA